MILKFLFEYSNNMDDILKKYWWILSKERTQNIDNLWWYDCWYA